jgi:hypothetical protein
VSAASKPLSEGRLMALPLDPQQVRKVRLVLQMAKKLQRDIGILQRYRADQPPKAFFDFCRIRNHHNEIQGLVFVIRDKMAEISDLLPAGMDTWLMTAKLRAISIFVEISLEFVRNPPLTLTGSLTARDVLDNEMRNFSEARTFFNNMLMEQAVDDKLSDQLDRTLGMIDETIGIIEGLLAKSRNYLEEFV